MAKTTVIIPNTKLRLVSPEPESPTAMETVILFEYILQPHSRQDRMSLKGRVYPAYSLLCTYAQRDSYTSVLLSNAYSAVTKLELTDGKALLL